MGGHSYNRDIWCVLLLQGREAAIEAVRGDPSLLASVQEEVNSNLQASPEALLDLADDDLMDGEPDLASAADTDSNDREPSSYAAV